MTPPPRRIRRLLRAAAGLAIVAVLLAGLPYTLLRLTGPPLPRHLPTWPQTQVFLTTPLTDEEIVKGLASVVWVLWAIFALSVLTEAAAAVRGAPAPRLPVIAPFQAAAATLIGVTIAASLPAAHAAPRPAPSLHTALTATTATTATAGPLTAGQPAPAAAPAPLARPPGPAQRYDTGAARPRVYRVVPGDDLWAIAARFLGNGERWHEIFDLNQGKPQPDGRALTDPSLIYPGWVLLLSPPASHNSSQPARHSGHPAPRRTPAAPPSRAPHRESPGRTPYPATPTAHPHPQQVAVHLPSGALVGISVAIMVAAALALASIQRRRRYRPRARLTGSLQPDRPPLPAVITALRRAAAAASTDDDTSPDTGMPPLTDPYLDPYDDTSPGPGQPGEPSARPHAAQPGPQAGACSDEAGPTVPPSREPGTIPLGVRGTSETALDTAALGGLGLTGPGAPAAARAILATLLAQAGPAHTGAPPAVIAPTADLTQLLPTQHPAQIPGVSAPASLDAALDEMEAALLHHARTTSAPGTGDDPQTPAPNGSAHRPAAALIATPEPAAVRRLRGILESGRGLGAAAILLGAWPPGVTCHVAADGMITDVTPPGAGLEGTRLFHLGADDAAAIAAVLREACGTPAGEYYPAPVPGEPPPSWPATAPRPAPGALPPPAPGKPLPAGDARPHQQDANPPPAAGRRVIRVEVLGPVRITARGGEIGGGLRKARELAAFLAVHPEGVSGEAISEALWPESPPGRGASQRKLALRKLRDLLRAAAGLTEPMLITLAAERYRLDPAFISTDVADFQAALERARAAGNDPARLAACQQAAALYRGPLADGAGYEWAEPYAEAARRRALDAWTRIAELLEPAGPDQALAALETALGHDPFNEHLYQRIMRLQAAAGRPDAVRRTLRLLEKRLTEIGVTPGPQTRQAAAALLAAAPAPGRQQPRPAPGGRPGGGGQDEQRTG